MKEEVISETLRRECLLANALLRSGTGMMGLETGCDPGRFYQFLFNTSIGLERLGKLVAICDVYVENGEFPSGKDLRRIGYDLRSLFDLVKTVRSRRVIPSKI